MWAGVHAVPGQVVHLVAQAAAETRRRAVTPDGTAQRALRLTAAVAVLGVALAAPTNLDEVSSLREL